MDAQQLRNILESCLLVAGKSMSIAQLEVVFDEDIDRPERSEIKEALLALQQEYEGRGIELVEVATGWRLQSSASMEHWVGRLLEEKSPRYSRALLETLVLIAYRQPITRGEIEEVRGVAVSSNIMRTLQERDWIKEVGFKDVPGKPALWGTTKAFLDYFNLKRLDELPTLAEARDLAEIDAALAAEVGLVDGVTDSVAANDAQGEAAQADNGAGESGESGEDGELEPTTDTDTPLNSEVPADANADDNESSDEEEGGSELINLAGNLNREHQAAEQPDLGAMVDGFGQTTDASISDEADEQAADSADAENATGDALDSEKDESGSSSSTKLELTEHSGEDNEATDSPAVEAMEISAHDLDIGEWKEPEARASRTEDDPDVGGGNEGEIIEPSLEEDSDIQRDQAETDLRRVIDDFADEHRQQLDAENEQRSKSAARASSQPFVPESRKEPVSTEGNGLARERSPSSFGDQNMPAADETQESDGNDKHHNAAKSGEP